jgi:hypothetical protein
MKNTLFLAFFLIASRLFAQDSSEFILFINPHFNNDKNDNPYKITNVNSFTNIPGFLSIEERMKPSYYNVGIDFKVYKILPHYFIEIFQVGIGIDKYYSSLPYKNFLGVDNWEYREKIEEINGQRINFQYGYGKQFSLDKERKLHFIVEGLFHFNASSFDKKLFNNKVGEVNPFDRKYYGSNLNFGIKCNVAINYQIYERFGIGLTFNNVFNVYGSKTYNNEIFHVDETETIVKIGQLSNPVFSLVFFL